MTGQLAFDLLLGFEGRQDGAPETVPVVEKVPSAAGRVLASPARTRWEKNHARTGTAKQDWTPERVQSYLVGLGLDPANLVVGPDMLKALPFDGVRRIEWEEPHRRACFPLRFLPRWCWEPYFVKAPFDDGGIGVARPWVALGREPSGLRPYWLVGQYDAPWYVSLGRPVLPACFVIGPECFEAEPCAVPPAVREAVAGASVLDEVLEALRGRPVWLEMYAAGAVGHVVSRSFALRKFRVDRPVPLGFRTGGEARVRIEGDSGFGLEVEAVMGFRAFPGYIIIDSYVPGPGYGNSVSLRWGRS